LSNRSYNYQNDLTNIVITDFELVNGRLRCNLTADGTTLDLSSMQVTEVLGVGNLSSLEFLSLNTNQLESFNPAIALPSSLQHLELSNNQMTTAGYIDSETWANTQPSFTNNCEVYIGGNNDSVNGTNLKTILESKNCTVYA